MLRASAQAGTRGASAESLLEWRGMRATACAANLTRTVTERRTPSASLPAAESELARILHACGGHLHTAGCENSACAQGEREWISGPCNMIALARVRSSGHRRKESGSLDLATRLLLSARVCARPDTGGERVGFSTRAICIAPAGTVVWLREREWASRVSTSHHDCTHAQALAASASVRFRFSAHSKQECSKYCSSNRVLCE